MVIRARDIGCPKSVSDTDFEEICGTFKIPQQELTSLRAELDQLTSLLAREIKRVDRLPNRRSDRKAAERAVDHIRKARTAFSNRGFAARVSMRSIAPSIGPMLSAGWLRKQFPTSLLTPKPKELPEPRGVRSRYRYDIEDLSGNERVGFVRDHALETIGALLGAIEDSLERGLDGFRIQPGAKGGRRPLAFRHYLLLKLAEIWRGLGRPLRAGPKSEFVGFCEAISEAIGWPTEGIPAAVRDVIKELP